MPELNPHVSQPGGRSRNGAAEVRAGFITTLVGFTSSFAVVLTGLAAVGASPAQSASGLMALCVMVGLGSLVLSLACRIPVTLAWSTPGAALLGGSAALPGGFSDAVGAFLVCAVLVVLTGLWPQLGNLVLRIPAALAQAMLAGVLLPLCLAPFSALSSHPAGRAAPRSRGRGGHRGFPPWATPLSFLALFVTLVFAVATGNAEIYTASLAPTLILTWPTWSWSAVLGLALPLYIVTMASQNVPGIAVLASYGYTAPWRAGLLTTGAGSCLAAMGGGHAINLAAISAALAAGDDSGVPHSRRWRSAAWAGAFYLPLGLGAAAITTVAAAAPVGIVAAVAGLALIAALTSSVQGAWADTDHRIAGVLTFLVAASGLTIAGISSAFWALVVGLLMRWLLGLKQPKP
ncbi:benzoate/H(+) symporter BenE family transporter [Galactobacter sp.]|uniref:benzoate/H(+) symporter BenE family transporter n=1 Tax=Galactobacter sp. TaxID=2676125 RepID=UPI0025C19002|nr:benzoate/H(+) symporter BenE family transporter [Galactobacter sp.]